MFLDLYLKFDIFISKQKTLTVEKYLVNAAAEAPAYEPISKIFTLLFLKF